MKILIVDDERMICEWLQFCIGQNPECQLTGCAHNGEQALALFQENEPDVVFTDIKMPVMGGLELLKRIKEISPETVVVLLTAFAEFDLAREAIRQGGDDYLLKTEMNNQSFKEVLERLKKRVTKHEVSRGGAETESTGRQHSIIGDILREGRTLGEEDVKKLKECNIRWRDEGLFAVAVWKKEVLEEFILPENPEVHHVVGFEYDRLTYVIVGNLERDRTELQKIQLLHEYGTAIVQKNRCMAGISTVTGSLAHVADAIIEAAYSLSRGYYMEKEKVWPAEMAGNEIRSLVKRWESGYRKTRRELYEVSGQEFYQTIEAVLDHAKQEGVFPVCMFAAFCCDAMEMAYMRFAGEDAKLMHHMLLEEKRAVSESVSCAESCKKVTEFIRNALAYQEMDERNLSKGVAAAVDYVRHHYSEPISLESVSREVHLNTEYLSRIFKEETGCTYSTFLSETRLQKAAYLLSHTPERVQKIAESVGYPNVSYFSTTFKKRYGVNPYEYRRGEEKDAGNHGNV